MMLMDLDYFFAQCEEVKDPSIKNRPVVVCVYSGRSEDSGAVSTANYIARKYGVKSGIPIFQAKKRLEGTDAVFLPVNFELYEEVSEKTMNILRGYADRFELVGIDEAYLDVSQRVGGDFDKARELAQKIKDDIRAQQKITCSIGIAPNKLVAKIAADSQKPDGLTTVKPEDVQNFLSPLPVNHLIGVGKKTEKKMQALGIKAIGDLANYEAQRLIEVFGKTTGVYFHNAAHGIDDEPVQERGEAESISRISTLKQDTRDLNVTLEKVNQLCDELHEDLVQRNLSFRQVGIVAILRDLSVHSRSKTFEHPTDDSGTLKKTVKELFENFLQGSDLELRRVGVRISGFVKKQDKQKKLTTFLTHNED
jgi:DNA polymerase IV (DinB-like DNA polymerase)